MSEEQNAAASPVPASRVVETGRGWEWVVKSWPMFTASPGKWMLTTIVYFILYSICAKFPWTRGFIGDVMAVVLTAGMLFACDQLRASKPLLVGHLFEGFRRESQSLFVTGAIYALACLVIGAIFSLMMGAAISASVITSVLMNGGIGALLTFLVGVVAGSLMAILVWLALGVPVAMAVWFAPALVIFDKVPPVDALRASFDACLKNMMPFLLYGVVMVVPLILGSVTVVGLLVVSPLIIISIYISYREIFHGES